MLPNRIALNILYMCFKNTVAIISSYKSDLELNKLSDLFLKNKRSLNLVTQGILKTILGRGTVELVFIQLITSSRAFKDDRLKAVNLTKKWGRNLLNDHLTSFFEPVLYECSLNGKKLHRSVLKPQHKYWVIHKFWYLFKNFIKISPDEIKS